MRPVSHLVISAFSAAFIYAWFLSFSAALASFLAGVFIDLDHVPEYWAFRGRKSRFKDFYRIRLADQKEKIYLFLHSFELIFLLWCAINFFKLDMLWVAVAFNASAHLLLDQFSNPRFSPYTYFLTYRILKKFKSRYLFIPQLEKENSR